MPVLNGFSAALAWLGRYGAQAVAASAFVAVAVPQIAGYVKPYLGATVFVLLLFSYLRTDPAAFRAYVRRPGIVAVAALWAMVAVPLLCGAIYTAIGLPAASPALYTIMILHIAVAPITSSAAFAGLLGLDVALSLTALIASSALSPITTVALSTLFLGTSMFSPLELGGKLFFFFAASGAVAYGLRRIVGQDWLERRKEMIDGLNVIAVFVFAAAAMDGVPRHVADDPLFALEIFVLVSGLSAAIVALSWIVFRKAGQERALVIGLIAGFRNLGLIMAAVGAALPDLAWFYFSMVQFPIFLFPLVLKPLARRLKPQEPALPRPGTAC